MSYRDDVRMIKALADENRLAILELLQDGEKCGCVILEQLNVTQPTLSHHMKTLENAGFVNVSKRGKWNYYSLNKETLTNFMREFNQLFFNSDNCICQEEHNKETKEERLIS